MLLALGLRLHELAARPMHTDEAVQGMFLIELLEGGHYVYNPREYHGPTLYYLTLPLAFLRGEHTGADLTETTLRLLPVLFGVGLIPLLALWRRRLGPWAVGWAALFIAVSPVHLYYSRYYIQESLLVFFFFAFLTGLMRYSDRPHSGWALFAGISAGLAHATKETSILMFAALALALVLARWLAVVQGRALPVRLPRRDLLLGAGAAIAVSVLFYSSFFTNWRGVPDSVLTYLHFASRAGGQGHEKPWFTHLQWIAWTRAGGFIWSEALLLGLAVVGVFFSNVWKITASALPTIGKSGVHASNDWKSSVTGIPTIGIGVLATYAVTLIVMYSVIPYKTPWLMLGPMQVVAVLAGVGAAALLRRARGWLVRGLVATALMAGTVQLGWQAARAVYRFPADARVPYVYSHTSPDAVRLSARLLEALALLPEEERWAQVAAEEYWPLPWYLRSIPNVGYWNVWPDHLEAPVIVLDAAWAEEAQRILADTHTATLAGLRPGVIVQAWIRNDLWQQLISGGA